MKKLNCAKREVRVSYRCMDQTICSGFAPDDLYDKCEFRHQGKCINQQMWEKRDRLETLCQKLNDKMNKGA